MTAEEHTQLMKKEEEVPWKSLHKLTITIMPRFALMFSKIVLFCTNISIITEISRNKEKKNRTQMSSKDHIHGLWLVNFKYFLFDMFAIQGSLVTFTIATQMIEH